MKAKTRDKAHLYLLNEYVEPVLTPQWQRR